MDHSSNGINTDEIQQSSLVTKYKKDKKRGIKKKPQVKDLTTPIEKFGGLTENDVRKLVLPDHLFEKLDIIFVGINPGLVSAYKGHHYCSPTNHFWPLLFESGLLPVPLTYESDYRCIEYGIGLTNIVARTTRNAEELSKSEIMAGKERLVGIVKNLNPLVLCFNGKKIYEIFSGKKTCDVGRQECIEETAVYVMPSTSGLVAQYPSRKDKLVFFHEVKSIRDELRMKSHYKDSSVPFPSPDEPS